MAKFEYTVKFNGKKYFPGEEVPMESNTESVAVAENVAVAETVEEPVKEKEPDTKSVLTKKADEKKNSKGKKPKA